MPAPWALNAEEAMAIKRFAQALVADNASLRGSLDLRAKETGIEQAVRMINRNPAYWGLTQPIQPPHLQSTRSLEASQQSDQET
jgi:hypothetical protein